LDKNIPEKVKSIDDTNNLVHLKGAINEALRLCPPAGSHPVTALKRVTLPNGIVIEKGSTILVNVYGLLRNKSIFPSPDQFLISRWASQNSSENDIYSADSSASEVSNTKSTQVHASDQSQSKLSRTMCYIPFLAGPHVCLGKQLALSEMSLVLAVLLKEFEFTFLSEKDLKLVLGMTLRPERGASLFVVKKRVNK